MGRGAERKEPMFVRQKKTVASAGDPILGNGVMFAPICGVSDSAYRRVCREMGAGVLFSEMISAEGLAFGAWGSWKMLKFHPEEEPLSIQLSTASPDYMAKACSLVEELGVSSININMGCPARKVVKGDKGAGLMKNPDLAAKVVEKAVAAVKIPVTVKMRSGWTEQTINYLELGRKVQEAGARAVILHPRTRKQAYSGFANWDHIRNLKEELDVPVIGNGDVVDGQSAVNMLKHTACDGIMIARGSFGNPWIFREVLAAVEGRPIPPRPSGKEIYEAIRRQVELKLEDTLARFVSNPMKKHMVWYSKGLADSAEFRQVVVRQQSIEKQLKICKDFFMNSTYGNET